MAIRRWRGLSYISNLTPHLPAEAMEKTMMMMMMRRRSRTMIVDAPKRVYQGYIIRSILPSRMGARGVSSEHVENMEMFSFSPT